MAAVLKGNKKNKTSSSRLTRSEDRLLPFDFEMFHASGRTIGIADYLSRHASPIEGESVKGSELLNTWFTVNRVNNLNDILADELDEAIRGRRWLKLQRSDKRSKSAHLPLQNKQTVSCEKDNPIDKRKMGRPQSTCSEINQFQA